MHGPTRRKTTLIGVSVLVLFSQGPPLRDTPEIAHFLNLEILSLLRSD